jgi:hypothetical protein
MNANRKDWMFVPVRSIRARDARRQKDIPTVGDTRIATRIVMALVGIMAAAGTHPGSETNRMSRAEMRI